MPIELAALPLFPWAKFRKTKAGIKLHHIGVGMDVLLSNPQFYNAWSAASEEEKYKFIGSFAPMAINGGRGHASGAAKALLGALGFDSLSLNKYTDALPNASAGNAKRGAEKGKQSMDVLFPD